MNDRLAQHVPNLFGWSLPFAFLLWMLMLWEIGVFLSNAPILSPPTSNPIDAQIIELPAIQPPPQPTPKSRPKSAPEAAPKIIPSHPVTTPKVSLPTPPALPPVANNMEPPAPLPPPAPVVTSPDNSQAGTAQMGAHAIYQPKPVIPEELRDETLHIKVLARFHIGADGKVTVELLKPAPDPRINQVVLNTLKTWRYFPAIQSGKAVASTEDVQVAIDVGD